MKQWYFLFGLLTFALAIRVRKSQVASALSYELSQRTLLTPRSIFDNFVRFQVLTVASMKMIAFWDTTPCSLVGVDCRLRGAYCLHHQGVSNVCRPEATMAGYCVVSCLNWTLNPLYIHLFWLTLPYIKVSDCRKVQFECDLSRP
jgi:hypothetical protein